VTERMLNWAYSSASLLRAGPIKTHRLKSNTSLNKPSTQHDPLIKSNTNLNKQSNTTRTIKQTVSRRCAGHAPRTCSTAQGQVHLFIYLLLLLRRSIARLFRRRRLQAETAAGAASSGGARRRPQTEPGGRRTHFACIRYMNSS
jgi:hypothetical protein